MAAGADAAVVGNTTFGGGLPAGEVTGYAFDACVRFDGTVAVAEIAGHRLAEILARANPDSATPFAQRSGEFLVADGPDFIDLTRTYRLATNDWGVRNQKAYFAGEELVFKEIPGLKVKAAVLSAFATATLPTEDEIPDAAPTADQLYDMGKTLFETLAPDEIKEQFEFPTKEQWDVFATRFQRALESEHLEDLAEFEPEAKAALAALRALPGYEDYADWLEGRIDYVEAAKQAVARPVPVPPSTPPPGKSGKTTPFIPHYDLWLVRMQARPVPANAAKLMPGLRRIFATAGLPADLAWLAEAESTLNPAARSPSGAKGLFQLMPATAKELGLSTFLPDERTDPEKSARAAAQLLGQLHTKFGDWPLALAAYNAGAGRVQRTLDKKGAKTFGEIASALPAETRMYVPKVLATLMVRAGLSPEQL
jgi:membrane-bound lytic murein transglycosylase D